MSSIAFRLNLDAVVVQDARVAFGSGGVVQNIPVLNQLSEPTLDGQPDENSRDNCVFCCDAMLSRFFRPDLQADGDAVKDSCPAYGQGYTGFSSQDTLIASGVLTSRWGLHSYRLNARNGSRADLLADLAALADEGIPSVVTIPSLWNSQPTTAGYNPDHPNFYTHACVYAGRTAGGQHVLLNPWGGFLMYYGDAELALRLCFLCAYPVGKAGAVAPPPPPPGATPVIVLEIDSTGKLTGAHDTTNGNHVNGGFAQWISDHKATDATIAVGEPGAPLPEGASYCVLRGAVRVLLTWSPQAGVIAYGGDPVSVVQDLALRPPVVTTVVQTVPVTVTAVTTVPSLTAADDAGIKADLDDIAVRIGLTAHS